MKKIYLTFITVLILWGCKTTSISSTDSQNTKEKIHVNINLIDVKGDKVFVVVKAPLISTETITYRIPKMVPGTYSEDNFGKYIDNLKAYDIKGNLLATEKLDDNTWLISQSKSLDKITYLVNDTFDIEKGTGFGKGDVFSPTGSNIDVGKNFMINTHCFVGYFDYFMSIPYNVTISHPANLWGATSMIDQDSSETKDLFMLPRYSELVENPIMYSKPNFTTFKVDDMDIQIAVYSPNGIVTAESITPDMKTTMTAQKHFLGPINSTKRYTIILYLSNIKRDAQGMGALEHPTSTTVVMPEYLSEETLSKTMKDVVAHEFFHIVTPLTIHSQEIQNFDYNNPKMSEHLWMYEGVTEYFANLFQINQGLINEDEFYNRIDKKIENARKMSDNMPFTTMSANVLLDPYKDQYLNVYEKGALIGMCIDIIIREKSNGERGILDLMHKLSNEYGISKSFNDNELFSKITALTYPEVGEFLLNYVSGTTPIPYPYYLAKVGVTKTIVNASGEIFSRDNKQYIVNENGKIVINSNMDLNVFFTSLELKGGDKIIEINDKKYTPDKVNEILYDCENWKENDPITVKITRNGKEKIIKGTVQIPLEEKELFKATDQSKSRLRNAWLKG